MWGKAKAKAKEKYRRVEARLSGSHAGNSTPNLLMSRNPSPARRPVSVGGDSTSLGLPLAENSGSQSQAVLSERSDALNYPSHTTTAEFESVPIAQVPEVTVSQPEDLPTPTHDPDQPPVGPPPPSPGVPTADNRSTPSIPNTPDSLPTSQILPPAATTLGDMPGCIPGSSVPLAAVPSVPSTILPNSQENLASGISAKPSGLSLWAKAWGKLSEDDKKAFPLHDTNKTPEVYIEDILEATKKSRDICVGEKKRFTVWGKTIIVRDVADKIIAWVDKFKEIGDCAVQYDPVHAALPWAAVRFLLQIAVNQKETMEAVLIGVERIARPLVRCALYEMLYLEPGLGLLVCKSLEGALEEFYLAVLKFLAFAKRYFDKSSPGRMFYGLLVVDGQSNFGPIERKEAELLYEVQAAEAELRRRDHGDLEHKTLSAIEDRHKKLKLMLQAMEMPIARIDLNVGKIQNDIGSYIEGEKRNKILKWISPVEYEMHHRNARENLLDNTGQWLFDRKEFREWRTSSASEILWLHGIPGAGKTKLVCAVIDFLESKGQKHEPIVYFYCNRNENQRRDPAAIIQAIVKQLSVALLPCLPRQVTAIYNKRKERGFAAGPLGFKESCDLVYLLLDLFAQTTIIIDALDEADPRNRGDLLDALKTTMSSSNSLVKIFIASRDDVDIKLELEEVPNLYIRAADNGADINRFIRREVETSIGKRGFLWGKVTNELKEMIILTVAKKADGMFQWAALQVTHLCKIKLVQDIESGLGRLPKTLEDAYSQAWEDALSEEPYAQRLRDKSLMWVMCALCPLNQELWASASYWPDEVPEDGVLTLFELCRNLVTWDKERECVIFAHLSVREYIEVRKFNAIDAHSIVAKSCLSFLNAVGDGFVCVQANSSGSAPVNCSFFNYSALCWAEHCQYLFDEGKMGEETETLLRGFLGTPANPGQGYAKFIEFAMDRYSCQAYLEADSSDRPFKCASKYMGLESLSSIPLNPLFALSYFPFMAGLQDLWGFEGVDVNCKNQWGRSLLFVAVMRDNECAMNILLGKGAKVNMGSRSSITNPLVYAVQEGKAGTVIRLIKDGVEATPGLYPDVLHLAAHQGGRKVVGAVMANGICKINSTVLAMAVMNSRYGEDIVEILLTQGVDIEITGEVMAAVAGCDNSKTQQLLFAAYGDAKIDGAVLVSVVTCLWWDCTRVEILLNGFSGIKITTAVLLAAVKATNHKYCSDEWIKIVETLLARCTSAEITTAVLLAAVKVTNHGYYDREWIKIVETLLARCTSAEITPALLKATLETGAVNPSIAEILLTKCAGTEITTDVLIAVVKNSCRVAEVYLTRCTGSAITAAVLTAAVGNTSEGYELTKLLLTKCTGTEITTAVLVAAAKRMYNNREVMELLLAKCDSGEITEAVFITAMENPEGTKMEPEYATLEMLLDKANNIAITEAVMVAAVRTNSNRVLGSLLQRDEGVTVTEAVLVLAAKISGEMLDLLLSRRAGYTITAGLLIAVIMASYHKPKFLNVMFTECAHAELTEAVLIAVVSCDDACEMMDMLLERGTNCCITEAVMIAAVTNISSGHQIVQMLIARFTDIKITQAVLVAGAQNWSHGHKIVEMFLERVDPEISEQLLIASKNFNHRKEIMQMLLDKCANTLTTETILIAAVLNSADTPEALEMMLAKCANTLITERVLITVVLNAGTHKALEMLLAKFPNTAITETVLIAAAEDGVAPEALEMLLARCTNTLNTIQVLITAAEDSSYGHKKVEILLSKCANTPITEEVLIAAAQNCQRGYQIMEMLLAECPNAEITEEILIAACKNSGHCNEILAMSLAKCDDTQATDVAMIPTGRGTVGEKAQEVLRPRASEILITESVLVAAARKDKGALKVLEFLLPRYANIPITEAVLVAVVGGGGLFECLGILEYLQSRGHDILITEAVAAAAAGGSPISRNLGRLVQDYGIIPVTEAVVAAAAGSDFSSRALEFLLSRDFDIPITEAVVVAAARSRCGGEALEFLLSRRANIPITEAVVVAAAGSWWRSEALEFLLSRGVDIPITEAVVVAAARSHCGGEALEFLLSRHADIPITEAVVVAAAGGWSGSEALEFLLSRHADITVTEAVVVAAAGGWSGSEALEFLLSRHADITVTEAVVVAAAGSWWSSEALEFLLSRGADIPITEAVVVAAAGGHVSEAMEFLLSRYADIQFTEAAIAAAAGGIHGPIDMLWSLRNYPDIPITEAVWVAAVGNQHSMRPIRRLLARVTSISITDKIKEAAARNPRLGKRMMKLLLANEAILQPRSSPPMLNPLKPSMMQDA